MSDSDFNKRHQLKSTESKIVASLERISQVFRVLLWQESIEHALSPIQIQVLIFLLYHSPEKRKVSYLADEFNLTKATISETIKTLQLKGLVTKQYEPHDSRSFMINLTNTGQNIADKTSYFSEEIFKPIDKLNEPDKENLLLSLLDIIRHLNQSGLITIQRMCMTCQFYRTEQGQQPFCKLLNQNLYPKDLQIDCPEHVSK